MTQETKKPKASEKLKALENQLMATARRTGEMELIIYNLSRENEILKDALQLLHDKQESVIALLREGQGLSDDNINNKVTDLKVAALKQKVDELVENGQIVAAQEIGDNSLVVSRELNQKGEVENPRLQFLTSRLVEELKTKFVGKKVGDLIETPPNEMHALKIGSKGNEFIVFTIGKRGGKDYENDTFRFTPSLIK